MEAMQVRTCALVHTMCVPNYAFKACSRILQAGIEKLRAAKLFNYDLYAYNNTQQLMNAISQLCQDEHLGKACQVVESELLSTPWVQTSEFHQALQGKYV